MFDERHFMNRFNQILLGIVIVSGILTWYTIFYKPKAVPNQNPSLLIVGTNAEYAPYVFLENDVIVGFDIDVIREVGRRIGKQVDIKNMPFTSLIPQVQTGMLHAIIGGIAPTKERQAQILFTRPYFSGDPFVIITRVNAPQVHHVDDLKGREVVVNEGYTADLYMSQFPDITLQRLATPTEAFLALQSGRAYAYVAAQSSVKPFFELYGTQEFAIALIPGTEDSDAIGVSKAYPEIFDEIQNTIEDMIADGTIQQLIEKWKLS